jgi:hypothetical protein
MNFSRYLLVGFVFASFGCSLQTEAAMDGIKKAAGTLHGEKFIFSCYGIKHELICHNMELIPVTIKKIDYYGSFPSDDYIKRAHTSCEKEYVFDACGIKQYKFPKAGKFSLSNDFDYDVIGGCKYENTGKSFKIAWYYPASDELNTVEKIKNQCELDGNEFLEAEDQDKDF